MTGNTLWSYSGPNLGHGTQVEYHSPDGQVFLWYPGNRAPVRGAWKVDGGFTPRLCYMYQENSYNPLTRQRGGKWECRSLAGYELPVMIKGDPFNLASGKLPFVIPDKASYDPRDLMQMAGRSPDLIAYAGLE